MQTYSNCEVVIAVTNFLLSKPKVVLVTLAECAVLSSSRPSETSEASKSSETSSWKASTSKSSTSKTSPSKPEIVLIALTEQRVLNLSCGLGGDQRADNCEEQESGSHHLVGLLGFER